jgi:hypothetical protein
MRGSAPPGAARFHGTSLMRRRLPGGRAVSSCGSCPSP